MGEANARAGKRNSKHANEVTMNRELFYEISDRLLNAGMAAAGVVLASTTPIVWTDPQFIAGAVLTIIPAIRNTGEYIVAKRGKQ